MTAGTVVITGGILATAILLCIIVVLCYCRLQYYCCKKSGFDADGACPQPQYACSVCSSPTPEPTPPQSFCPTCTPYSSTFYIRTLDEVGKGGERIVYRPACYDSPPCLAVPTVPNRPMSCHAISTDV